MSGVEDAAASRSIGRRVSGERELKSSGVIFFFESTFDVRCWMFDVQLFGRTNIGTFNIEHRMLNKESHAVCYVPTGSTFRNRSITRGSTASARSISPSVVYLDKLNRTAPCAT